MAVFGDKVKYIKLGLYTYRVDGLIPTGLMALQEKEEKDFYFSYSNMWGHTEKVTISTMGRENSSECTL